MERKHLPSIACDVPSHIYSYSFELNPDWSEFTSPAAEVQEYFEGVSKRYGIDEHIRFNEAVIRCTWMDGEWEIETEKGHIERVRWVIAATGILHHPKYPDIDGLDTFEGPMFHTARWDHDIDIAGKDRTHWNGFKWCPNHRRSSTRGRKPHGISTNCPMDCPQ